MFSAGIRNPQRSLLICVAITLVAWAFVAWGAFEMHASGQDTLDSGLKIGLALLPAILAPVMALNFWGGINVIASIRRGENRIARWTVTAAELAEFAASNEARNALGGEHHNDWSPPRDPPLSGIEIIFTSDGVLVGDTYFTLSTTGLFRFTSVGLLPDRLPEGLPAIAFKTITTYANRFGMRTMAGELRAPVSRLASAEAAKVVAHFEQVGAGKVIANPNFYRRRVRFGLIGAPISLAIAALGFALGPDDMSNGSISIPTLMVIFGLVSGIAMLILAAAAKRLDGAQRRER